MTAVSPIFEKIFENPSITFFKFSPCTIRNGTQFLEFIYRGAMTDLQLEDLESLVMLSRRYQIPEMEEFLSRDFICKITVKNFLECLRIAQDANLRPSFMERLRTYFSKYALDNNITKLYWPRLILKWPCIMN